MSVVLIEDDPFTSEGIALYLRRQGKTVYDATNVAAGKALIQAKRPSAAIIDIQIPPDPHTAVQRDQNEGVRLTLWLKETYPTTGVVIFSAFEDRGEAILELVRAGVRGIVYQLKGSKPAALLAALEAAEAGQVRIDPDVTDVNRLAARFWQTLLPVERPYIQKAAQRLPRLTPREQEVACRIAAAHTQDAIAVALKLAPKTIENYTSRVYDKLGLKALSSSGLRQPVILAKAHLWYELHYGPGTP